MKLKTNKKSFLSLLFLCIMLLMLCSIIFTALIIFTQTNNANVFTLAETLTSEVETATNFDVPESYYSSYETATATSTKTAADFASVVPEGRARLLKGNSSLADKDAFIITIFGDGFRSSDQNSFFTNALACANSFMNTSPMNETSVASLIKIYAVGVVSESNHIRGDGCTTKAAADSDVSNTYFHTRYWVNGIERLMYIDSSTDGNSKLNELTNVFCPYTDSRLILSNSTKYGGGGGTYAVCSIHSSAPNIFIHELGHSVGGLGDEYWSGDSYYQEKVNKTLESDPTKVSWSRFIGLNGIGVYTFPDQINSSLPPYYRPALHCMMKDYYPFCEVCKEQLRISICQKANSTRMFYQQYADEIKVGIHNGKDMREYFILRKGAYQTTCDNISSGLTIRYYKNGSLCAKIPNEAGTYEVEAIFAGNSTYEACSLRTTYTITSSAGSEHKNISYVAAKQPTCTSSGNIAYWYCAECVKYYLDSALTNEITYSQTLIAKVEHKICDDWESNATYHWHECSNNCGTQLNRAQHTESDWLITKQATYTETGLKHKICAVCKYEIATQTIPILEKSKVNVNVNIQINEDGSKNVIVDIPPQLEYVLEYYNEENQKLPAEPTTAGTYKVIVVITTPGYEASGTYEKTFVLEDDEFTPQQPEPEQPGSNSPPVLDKKSLIIAALIFTFIFLATAVIMIKKRKK